MSVMNPFAAGCRGTKRVLPPLLETLRCGTPRSCCLLSSRRAYTAPHVAVHDRAGQTGWRDRVCLSVNHQQENQGSAVPEHRRGREFCLCNYPPAAALPRPPDYASPHFSHSDNQRRKTGWRGTGESLPLAVRGCVSHRARR